MVEEAAEAAAGPWAEMEATVATVEALAEEAATGVQAVEAFHTRAHSWGKRGWCRPGS